MIIDEKHGLTKYDDRIGNPMSEVVRQINTSPVQVLEDSENIDVGQYSKSVIFSLVSSM